MGQYEWIFVVETMSDETVESIYADFDAMASSHGGCDLLTLTLDGPSALDAAKHAIATLSARYSVQVVRTYQDLVTRADIAERLDVTIQAVGQWARGDRWRGRPFPEPFNLVSGGIWLWGDVYTWSLSVGKATDGELAYPSQSDHAEVDTWLESRKRFKASLTFARSSTTTPNWDVTLEILKKAHEHAWRKHVTSQSSRVTRDPRKPLTWTETDYEIAG